MPKTIFSGSNKVVVDALRAARIQAGLTQAELAARIGRDQSHISLIEGSQRRLDLVEFAQVARALGRDPAELYSLIAQNLAQAGWPG